MTHRLDGSWFVVWVMFTLCLWLPSLAIALPIYYRWFDRRNPMKFVCDDCKAQDHAACYGPHDCDCQHRPPRIPAPEVPVEQTKGV